MNLIICGENCVHQADGYCCLEGHTKITNALTSPCCYFEKREKGEERKKRNDKNR